MVMPSAAVAVWEANPILPLLNSTGLNNWNKILRGLYMDKLLAILAEIGIPFAYDHFAEGESPEPPFICYLLPETNHFAADGIAYFKINEVNIELYTDIKDLDVEQRIEAVLDQHGIFYAKSEVWIESERLYEVLYSFELEA
jgi:hypothetical protein